MRVQLNSVLSVLSYKKLVNQAETHRFIRPQDGTFHREVMVVLEVGLICHNSSFSKVSHPPAQACTKEHWVSLKAVLESQCC